MLIAASFTVAHGMDTTSVFIDGRMDREVVIINNSIIFSHKNTHLGNPTICDNKDGP